MAEAVRRLRGAAQRGVARVQHRLRGPVDPSSTILVAGSARGGTSWLARLLATLPRTHNLFEPLNPEYVPAVASLYPAGLRSARYLPPTLADARVEALLGAVLQGQIRNTWTDLERGVWLPQRYLVKEVRANLMLGYLSDHFHPSVIHLVRHPCAVIASRMALRWGGTVQELLMQEALVERYLAPWADEIARVNDPVEVQALWWAVENHVARAELSTRPHRRVFFEHLVLEPTRRLAPLFAWLGAPPPRGLDELISRPSPSARRDVAYENRRARLTHWQSVLDPTTQRMILKWPERFELPWYGDSPLPLTSPLEHREP